MNRHGLLRTLSLLSTAAIVFAPAPNRSNEGAPPTSRGPTDSLAAKMLSPTFDQGVIRGEGRSLVLHLVKRSPSETSFATIPVLAVAALVLLVALCRWRPDARQEHDVATLAASRAPPFSPVT